MSMNVKPGTKQTEVGVIPADWSIALLEKYAQVRSGIAKNANIKLSDPIRVHYLRVANVQDGFLDLSEMSEIEIERSDLRRFSVVAGDVLMNEGGDRDKLGRGCVWLGQYTPCVHQNHVFVVRCSPRLHSPYLTAWTRSATAKQFFINAGSQTTNLASINKTALGKLPIPLPPTLAEQEAIAGALSDADGLIESLEKLIAKKRQIKHGTMQELLTGKRRLPGFSGKWETKRLADLADIRSGGTPNTTQPQFWDGSIPWCTPTDITALSDFKYLSTTARTITVAGLKSSSAELLPPKSVVMTSRATIGECAINTVPVTTNQGFKNFIPFATTDCEFLYYILTTQKQCFISLCGGSTFLEIGKKQLQQYALTLPACREEQSAIAVILSDMDAEIAALEEKLMKARQVKQGMMQELLTGRTRLI